jgi:NAD(P)H-hydrate repair Nnr-like enzyme with NAD(P)H-hydrate dehydratase domain
VIDSGGLDLIERAGERTVITPHHREMAAVLGVDVADIARDPASWCARASDRLGVTVLLKGTHTHVASPGGTRIVVGPATGWLASAGTGDVLGGILGALLATHSAAVLEEPELVPRLAASAAHLHAASAELASGGGPLAALDVAVTMPEAVAHLLRTFPPL